MAKIDEPLISVIVPVYNVEKYIDTCIQSIIDQTYKNLEIILVDDATPDTSGKKCDQWEKKDKRIKVIHKQKNEGLFQARITGFESMRGEYFMTVDSDDYIKPDFVERFLDEATSSGADIVISNVFMVFGEGIEQRVGTATLKYSPSNVFDRFMRSLGPEKWGWSMWDKMYRTSLYKKAKKYLVGIDEKINASEDLLFAVDLCYYAQSTSYIDKDYVGYFYRQTPDSIMGSVSIDSLAAKLNDVTKVFFEVEKFVAAVGSLNKYKKNIVSSREWHLRINVDRIGGIYSAPLQQQNAELTQQKSELQSQNTELYQQNAELMRQKEEILNSKTYRTARFILSPYNKLRRMLK